MNGGEALARRNTRRRWAWGALGLCLLALLAFAAWFPGRLLVRQADQIEQRALEREAVRVAASLKSELYALEDLCRDWSDWDDAHRFMEDRNAAFVKANLGWASLLDTTHVNLVAFLDRNGGAIWSGFRSTKEGPDLPLPSFVTRGHPLPRRNGILLTAQGPLLVSMRPIVQSSGDGLPNGVLVMGRLLDDATLARVHQREAALFDVRDTLRNPPGADQAQRWRRLRAGEQITDFTPQEAKVHLLIPDLERRGGLWVEVRAPREVHHQGIRAGRLMSGTIAGALLMVGTVLAFSFWGYHRTVANHRRELQDLVEARTAELRRANRALEEASMVDALTGLRNRRYAELSLPEDAALALRSRHPGTAQPGRDDLIFFLLDIDHFKSVNDTHGHAAGDAVLRQVGDLLRRVGRASDLSIRWGGEEFLIVARQTFRAHGPTLALNLLQAFQDHRFILPNGAMLNLTCSIGYSAFPVVASRPEVLTFEQAIILADLCMYAAKRSGRNGWVGFTAPDSLDPLRLLDAFPRGFIHLAKSGILEVRCSLEDPSRLTWV